MTRLPMLIILILLCLGQAESGGEVAETEAGPAVCGIASWYGEQHRGRLMANGQPFDPDKFTAASWFYPLGTWVRVSSMEKGEICSVEVVITDRGPHKRLVAEGRIIDLGRVAFERLAHPDKGLLPVRIERVADTRDGGGMPGAGKIDKQEEFPDRVSNPTLETDLTRPADAGNAAQLAEEREPCEP